MYMYTYILIPIPILKYIYIYHLVPKENLEGFKKHIYYKRIK